MNRVGDQCSADVIAQSDRFTFSVAPQSHARHSLLRYIWAQWIRSKVEQPPARQKQQEARGRWKSPNGINNERRRGVTDRQRVTPSVSRKPDTRWGNARPGFCARYALEKALTVMLPSGQVTVPNAPGRGRESTTRTIDSKNAEATRNITSRTSKAQACGDISW